MFLGDSFPEEGLISVAAAFGGVLPYRWRITMRPDGSRLVEELPSPQRARVIENGKAIYVDAFVAERTD